MEKIIELYGQNTSFSNCMINMNLDTDNIENEGYFMYTEESNDLYFDIHYDMFLLKSFLISPQFINSLNIELFIQLLDNIPYDEGIDDGTLSLLEVYINNIHKFDSQFNDIILLKIISKLCYVNGVIFGSEDLMMSFDTERIFTTINTNTVFRSIILPLIVSNNIELMEKITNLIFQYSETEFCFLFIRTCIEFHDMIPQNFLYNMFGVGVKNEIYNTIKEFIINNIQNIFILLLKYEQNINFILTYLNEIIIENPKFILNTFNTNGNKLSYNIIHSWSRNNCVVGIKEIKNKELKLFLQNLMNKKVQSIPIIQTHFSNKKLKNILIKFNNIINGKEVNNFQDIIEEIVIICEYDNNTQYILEQLFKSNFINGEFFGFAISLFLMKYDKIQNIELKNIYIKLIQDGELCFEHVLRFIENYDKFDDYLKFEIQEKFSKFAIELFNPKFKHESILFLDLLEKIHGNKVDEILLPIFVENSSFLNKRQQMFIKRYLFANLFSSKDRFVCACFENNNKEYRFCDNKKINKLTLIKCLDIFYNNIENFLESKHDNENIVIINLHLITNIIDNLECSLEEKLQLKTKIFLDVEQILVNSDIEFELANKENNETIVLLYKEIIEASIKNPEIISYFLTDIKEEKMMVCKPIMLPLKNKKYNEIIFNILLIANEEDKIKIQKHFIDYLDINLKQGNTSLVSLYCKNIKKFDKEFQEIILCKAFECGMQDFDFKQFKTQSK